MKAHFNITLVFLLFSSCTAQNNSNKSKKLLEKIYEDQLTYYNTKIVKKDDYISIINFAKQERETVIKKTDNLIESDSFIILEGFSSGWGNFIGLIWNDKVAYSYRRSSTDKKIRVTRMELKDPLFSNKAGIDQHVIDKINKWDIPYINDLKNKIGMSVSDGYYFIATKVSNESGKQAKVETIGFEQFIKEDGSD